MQKTGVEGTKFVSYVVPFSPSIHS